MGSATSMARRIYDFNVSLSDDACGSAYHNLSACDFPYSPLTNCTDTYMELQRPLYLAVCGGLFVVAVCTLVHIVVRIANLQILRVPAARKRFPMSLYIPTAIFSLLLIFRSIDAFAYAGIPCFRTTLLPTCCSTH